MRPDFCEWGRSICVMSPVITIFVFHPIRVRNILICAGVVFCASSRITTASFSVRPRIVAADRGLSYPSCRQAGIPASLRPPQRGARG